MWKTSHRSKMMIICLYTVIYQIFLSNTNNFQNFLTIDGIVISTTTPCQSRPGSNDNEELTPHQVTSFWAGRKSYPSTDCAIGIFKSPPTKRTIYWIHSNQKRLTFQQLQKLILIIFIVFCFKRIHTFKYFKG